MKESLVAAYCISECVAMGHCKVQLSSDSEGERQALGDLATSDRLDGVIALESLDASIDILGQEDLGGAAISKVASNGVEDLLVVCSGNIDGGSIGASGRDHDDCLGVLRGLGGFAGADAGDTDSAHAVAVEVEGLETLVEANGAVSVRSEVSGAVFGGIGALDNGIEIVIGAGNNHGLAVGGSQRRQGQGVVTVVDNGLVLADFLTGLAIADAERGRSAHGLGAVGEVTALGRRRGRAVLGTKARETQLAQSC